MSGKRISSHRRRLPATAGPLPADCRHCRRGRDRDRRLPAASAPPDAGGKGDQGVFVFGFFALAAGAVGGTEPQGSTHSPKVMQRLGLVSMLWGSKVAQNFATPFTCAKPLPFCGENRLRSPSNGNGTTQCAGEESKGHAAKDALGRAFQKAEFDSRRQKPTQSDTGRHSRSRDRGAVELQFSSKGD